MNQPAMPHTQNVIRHVPWIGGLAILVIGYGIYQGSELAAGGLVRPDNLVPAPIDVARAKILWAIADLLLWLALLWNLGFALTILARRVPPKVMAAILSAVLLLLGIAFFTFGGREKPIAGGIANDLFYAVFQAAPQIELVIRLGNYATAAVIAALTAATYILATRRTEPGTVPDVKATKYLLYSAAALLAIGLMEIYFLFSWGALYYGGTATKFAATIAVAAGALFSAWLLILFMPIAVLDKMRIDDFIEYKLQEDPHLEREKILRRYDLEDPQNRLFQGFATFLPLMVGIATRLAEGVLPKLA
jgi:hypothetical protein